VSRRRVATYQYREEGEPEVNPNPIRCAVCGNPMLIMNKDRFNSSGQKPLCSDRCVQLERGNSAVKSLMRKMGKQKKNELVVFVGLYFVVAIILILGIYYFALGR